MKIAITGHNRGIGAELSCKLINTGHTVIGFSRSNGYDISADGIIDTIVNQAADCDIFVNNAWCQFKQIDLFKAIFAKWQEEDKLIVNINSKTAYMHDMRHEYPASKKELAKVARCTSLPPRRCRVTNIYPGYVDTMLVSHVNSVPKLTTEECADIIMWAMLAPAHIEVGELGFWTIGK